MCGTVPVPSAAYVPGYTALDSIHQREGTTILLVTHDIQEAIFLADKIVFLANHPGRIRTIMTPEFKRGRKINSKEALISLDGYFEFERDILRMMREEAVPEE